MRVDWLCTGCEWDYVVLTTVRSMQPSSVDDVPNLRWQRQHLGFITNEHQINVALTRARKGLIIIGRTNDILDSVVETEYVMFSFTAAKK